MKVKQLIDALRLLDPELPVYVRGYESGVNDVSRIRKVRVVRNANTGISFYGLHDLAYRSEERILRSTPGIELVGRNTKAR